jgi:hypothetical protein
MITRWRTHITTAPNNKAAHPIARLPEVATALVNAAAPVRLSRFP